MINEKQPSSSDDDDDDEGDNVKRSWKLKRSVFDRALPIHQAPNVINSEVLHMQHTTITDSSLHKNVTLNKVLQLFGQYFIALDWNE